MKPVARNGEITHNNNVCTFRSSLESFHSTGLQWYILHIMVYNVRNIFVVYLRQPMGTSQRPSYIRQPFIGVQRVKQSTYGLGNAQDEIYNLANTAMVLCKHTLLVKYGSICAKKTRRDGSGALTK